MKTSMKLLLCVTLIAGAGCQIRGNPRAELLTAQRTFALTVNVLTELKAQGQLGDDEIEDIGAMIHLGEKYLLKWEQAVLDEVPDADVVTAFQMIFAEMTKVRSDHDTD